MNFICRILFLIDTCDVTVKVWYVTVVGICIHVYIMCVCVCLSSN